MVGLEPEELQKVTEEAARGKPKPALEVRQEDHPLRALGPRLPLPLREAHLDLLRPRQAPGVAEVGDVVRGDGGTHPRP